jgi:hypothetical protein
MIKAIDINLLLYKSNKFLSVESVSQKYLDSRLAGMYPPNTTTLVRAVAIALAPRRPIAFLSETIRRPRPTAKAWFVGRRRPSTLVLQILRDLAASDGLVDLADQLAYVVRLRLYQPKHLTGFNSIRVREPGGLPRDGRWRGGRPRAAGQR